MLAKIPTSSLPLIKKWAALAKLARSTGLTLIAGPDAVTFAAGHGRNSAITIATNIYTRLTVGSEVLDDGSCSVNPEVFFKALATIRGEHFIVAHDGTEVSLTDKDSCTFTFVLNALDTRENAAKPLVADTEPIVWQAKLPGSQLKKVIEQGLTCVGRATSGYYHEQEWKECLHIRAHGTRLDVQGCDSFMLSQANTDAEVEGEGEALITGSFAKAIASCMPNDGEVTLKKQGQTLTVEGGNILAQVGVSAATFPDTSKIGAPTKDSATTSLTLNVADLKAVAERIVAFCGEGDSSQDNLLLSISPVEVRASFESKAVGSFQNVLETEVNGEGLGLLLGARMVKSIMSIMDSDKVTLYIARPTQPVRFEPAVEAPRETYIIAPRKATPAEQTTAS